VNLKLASCIVPLLLLLCVSGAAAAQIFSPKPPAPQRPIPVLAAPVATFTYPQHATLTFSVDWRVFTAGTAVFHLDQSGTVERISATADSTGAVNMLFPVVDRLLHRLQQANPGGPPQNRQRPHLRLPARQTDAE